MDRTQFTLEIFGNPAFLEKKTNPGILKKVNKTGKVLNLQSFVRNF
jgi:hypothetical protein